MQNISMAILVIGIGIPIFFVFCRLIASQLIMESRRGNQKFRIWSQEGSKGWKSESPLDVEMVLKSDKTIHEIEELAPSIMDTSIGLDLSSYAIAVTFAGLIILGINFSNDSALITNTTIALALEFFLFLGMLFVLHYLKPYEEPLARRLLILSTNVLGLLAMILAFIILARSLSQ